MTITHQNVRAYLEAKDEIKRLEDVVKEKRDLFVEAVDKSGNGLLQVGTYLLKVSMVETKPLDEEAIKQALGVDNLDAFRKSVFSQRLNVKAS